MRKSRGNPSRESASNQPQDRKQLKKTKAKSCQAIADTSADSSDGQQHEITTSITEFSGPLPPPEELEKYQGIYSEAAKQIFLMAAEEQTNRHQLQKSVVQNDRLKIYANTLVALGVLVVAGIAAWLGNTHIAVFLGLSGIIGPIVRILLGAIIQSFRDKSDKSEN